MKMVQTISDPIFAGHSERTLQLFLDGVKLEIQQ